MEASPLTGAQLIADYVTRLPDAPGVYRMLDIGGEVLYVGKAKSLKKRVSNYARGNVHNNRLTLMISLTHAMEFVTTQTERQALLLEANYIKRYKPKYNILLRDDKSFPYICITTGHEAPMITKHRGARSKGGKYFGPFASSGAVENAITTLQKVFLLRTCTDAYYANRSRPCLLYQIKRCAGPCTGEISREGYAHLVQQAELFLNGKTSQVRAQLAAEMEQAAERLEFEHAAKLRDRLNALSVIGHTQNVHLQHIETADVFAIACEAGHFCVQVFFVRNFQNYGSRSYFPQASSENTSAEVLGAFISQFYDDKPTPALVLLNERIEDQDMLAEALSERADRKVELTTPQRGEKREIVDYAARNATDALKRKLAESATQLQLMQKLAEVFHLDKPPERIEVYDNSHISGTNAVGAFIVAGREGFIKNQYRKFNIKAADFTAGDDFAMMREVLRRRFGHSVSLPSPLTGEGAPIGADEGETIVSQNHPHPPLRGTLSRQGRGEDSAEKWPLPDLIFIDGGQGQLNAAREVMFELGFNIPMVGIAKGVDRDAGRERFFMYDAHTHLTSFTLPPRDAVLFYIQRLRDESHRFVIGTHREKRAKAFTATKLDDVPGVGPTRKRALMRHFGTAKAVGGASLEDLMQVDGISEMLAQQIYEHFRG